MLRSQCCAAPQFHCYQSIPLSDQAARVCCWGTGSNYLSKSSSHLDESYNTGKRIVKPTYLVNEQKYNRYGLCAINVWETDWETKKPREVCESKVKRKAKCYSIYRLDVYSKVVPRLSSPMLPTQVPRQVGIPWNLGTLEPSNLPRFSPSADQQVALFPTRNNGAHRPRFI